MFKYLNIHDHGVGSIDHFIFIFFANIVKYCDKKLISVISRTDPVIRYSSSIIVICILPHFFCRKSRRSIICSLKTNQRTLISESKPVPPILSSMISWEIIHPP
jgi:hypothetical protein